MPKPRTYPCVLVAVGDHHTVVSPVYYAKRVDGLVDVHPPNEIHIPIGYVATETAPIEVPTVYAYVPHNQTPTLAGGRFVHEGLSQRTHAIVLFPPRYRTRKELRLRQIAYRVACPVITDALVSHLTRMAMDAMSLKTTTLEDPKEPHGRPRSDRKRHGAGRHGRKG